MSGLRWTGDQVLDGVQKNVAAALGEFGLHAEGYAKKELIKGHGVLTGTLRRSIHTAQPGYAWSGDDVEPGESTPERGGAGTNAAMTDKGLVIQLGSGLIYAMRIHQGDEGGVFEGYHFIRNGVDKAKPEMPEILNKHKLQG